MQTDKKIAVVIPCYKVAKHIVEVVEGIPKFVDFIIVVDDACPQNSGKLIEQLNLHKVYVLHHGHNQGVGGAVITGYKKALDLNSDIVIKIDGDGQMSPDYIKPLIEPLLQDTADYTKGNRFNDFDALKNMPKIRLFGNSLLSFSVKLISGYWNIMDPTNGFSAITSKTIEHLNLEKIEKRYFFEIDLLVYLNLNNHVVKDIPIPTKYKDEASNLGILHALLTFPPKMAKGFARRVFYKYFIYDFNMASIYLLMGLPLVLFGVFFGFYRWILAITQDIENSAGTIMLVALPIISGIQFLLQAISTDVNNIPKKK